MEYISHNEIWTKKKSHQIPPTSFSTTSNPHQLGECRKTLQLCNTFHGHPYHHHHQQHHQRNVPIKMLYPPLSSVPMVKGNALLPLAGNPVPTSMSWIPHEFSGQLGKSVGVSPCECECVCVQFGTDFNFDANNEDHILPQCCLPRWVALCRRQCCQNNKNK